MRLLLLLPLLFLTACSSTVTPPDTAADGSVSSRPPMPSSELTDYAQSLLGIPYRYGGSDPEHGFDCSGLVWHVYRRTLALDLPRSSLEMSHRGKLVEREELRPGDLVFFNTLHRKFSHVGIYLGSNSFIHAPSTGGNVRIEYLNSRYWQQCYNGARRISD